MPAPQTIVAISTPAGYAPRAVVRLSGPDAIACIEARFSPDDGQASRWRRTFRATVGRFALDGPVVPALVYVMRAPHSYTCEDVVELHLPGSPALLDMVLDGLLAQGARRVRLAEPGEFTRRAFLNGRIDLSRAEAVLSVIRARSESELLAASARLQGAVGRRCAQLQEQLTELRVRVEAALDFAEHGIELVHEAEFVRRCEAISHRMAAEMSRGRDEIASDGAFHVVLCGPPNVGKSSLINRLTGVQTAIVHHRAGTTRDAVSGLVELDGVRFRLSDTAGLMDNAIGPDAEAVRRARRQMETCHLVLLVLDGSQPLPGDVAALAGRADPSRLTCVANKCDLAMQIDQLQLARALGGVQTLRVSALTGEGMDELRAALSRSVAEGRLDAAPSASLFNARQRDAVRRALREVSAAERAVRDGMGYEFAAFNLRQAADALAEVTGEVTPQDVLDRIFSRFCIGK